MDKKLLFRADGNEETGLGHLYRLFALVEMFKDAYECILVTRSSSTHHIIPKEYKLAIMPETIGLNEEPDWLAKNYTPNEYTIIADGYHFMSSYQQKIKKLGFRLIYIDDLAQEHMFADVVINHSPQMKESDFSSEDYTQFALGTKYALLRPAFLEQASKLNKIESIQNAFVCFGGSDSFNLTYKVVKALLQLKEIETIHIVLGGAYQHAELFELAKKYEDKIYLYQNLDEKELLGVMQKSDMAVVPSSTILFELFCVKMPIYSGYFVENQKMAFKWFKKLNLVEGKGDFLETSENELKEGFESIIKSPEKYEQFINHQKRVIDGLQKQRLLEIVEKSYDKLK